MTLGDREIDYVETGEGPAILYVPGSFSTPAGWRAIQSRLPGYRHVATSLCGYGRTDDPRDQNKPGLDAQVDILARCADRIGAPYHLVGHSFGGTVALAAIASGAIQPRSLTTFEANPFPILADGSQHDLVDQTLVMARAFEAAFHDGDPDAAGRIIDFWGGAGSFAAMPEAARAYCRQTCAVNVLDWRSVVAIQHAFDDVPPLTLPVLLVRGEHANAVMRATTDRLAEVLAAARTAVVGGASHFPITTHPDACAALLDDFLPSRDVPG